MKERGLGLTLETSKQQTIKRKEGKLAIAAGAGWLSVVQ